LTIQAMAGAVRWVMQQCPGGGGALMAVRQRTANNTRSVRRASHSGAPPPGRTPDGPRDGPLAQFTHDAARQTGVWPGARQASGSVPGAAARAADPV